MFPFKATIFFGWTQEPHRLMGFSDSLSPKALVPIKCSKRLKQIRWTSSFLSHPMFFLFFFLFPRLGWTHGQNSFFYLWKSMENGGRFRCPTEVIDYHSGAPKICRSACLCDANAYIRCSHIPKEFRPHLLGCDVKLLLLDDWKPASLEKLLIRLKPSFFHRVFNSITTK